MSALAGYENACLFEDVQDATFYLILAICERLDEPSTCGVFSGFTMPEDGVCPATRVVQPPWDDGLFGVGHAREDADV